MGGFDKRIYPKANTTAQWYETLYDRSTFTQIDKFLLHTTETTGWPGYKGGASAPTITYFPKYRTFRQHNFLNRSARALVDPDLTPVRENRDNVVQIEIICYTDLIMADSVGGLKVTELTDDHLRDIADLYKFLHDEWGTPLFCNLEFPPYRPYKDVRMSSSVYDGYYGMLGHLHASGNSHTDPGNINAQKILSFAKAITGDTMPTVDEIWGRLVLRPTGNVPAIQELADAKTNTMQIIKMLQGIADKVGATVDVDEAAIANLVIAGLRDDIRGAVESALSTVQINADLSPTEIDAVADAVVLELNTRLAS